MADYGRRLLQTVCIFVILQCGTSLSIPTEADIINGICLDSSANSKMQGDIASLEADKFGSLRVFGRNLSLSTTLSFTVSNGTKGSDCSDFGRTNAYMLSDVNADSTTAEVRVKLPLSGERTYYICVKEKYRTSDTNDNGTQEHTRWIHQGSDSWLQIGTYKVEIEQPLMPLWLQISIVAVLLVLSGIFSGLNLGLMSLDPTDLKVIQKVGSKAEQRYAKVIAPVRKRGNFLLCTLLLGNVLVNSTLAILFEDLTSGAIAVVASTLGIVIFGEIIPQAICSRHGLAVGARTIYLTYIFMVITFPLSFPISKILDLILGEELGTVYNREKLRELVTMTKDYNELAADEVNIITGALELTKKTVGDIMTKIEDVYMVDINAFLDFETMSTIVKTGYTRIPVYEEERPNIVALLNVKDLAFVDPDDKTPLKIVCKFYNHPMLFAFEDSKLDAMLQEFKQGHSHLAIVQRVNTEGEGDPFYETVGLVTLEDIIEEIIQSEIVDETDTVIDNRNKRCLDKNKRDFSYFNQPDAFHKPTISSQLALAAYQFLSTTVEPFREDFISKHVLQRLIRQDIAINHVYTENSTNFIYVRGKVADYFVLLLQGKVEVEAGKENMLFEGGPFMYFGIQALTNASSRSLPKHPSLSSISSTDTAAYNRPAHYVPDFSVKATMNLQYLKITRAQYIAARRATMVERHPRSPAAAAAVSKDREHGDE